MCLRALLPASTSGYLPARAVYLFTYLLISELGLSHRRARYLLLFELGLSHTHEILYWALSNRIN